MVYDNNIFDDFLWFESNNNNNNYHYPTDYYLFQHYNLNLRNDFLSKEKTWFLLLSDYISNEKLDNDDLLINELLEDEVLIYEPEIHDQETTSFCKYCKLKLEKNELVYHESCFELINEFNNTTNIPLSQEK